MQDQQLPGASEPTSPSAGISPLPPKKHRRALVTLVTVVAILVIGLVVWVVFFRNGSSDQQAADAKTCGNDIVTKASPAIRDNDINALEPVANAITKKQGYKQDADCDYILDRYYIMTGNADQAESTLSDLKTAYGKSAGYSTAFNPPAISTDALQQSIDVLRANQAQSQQQVLSNDPNGGVQ